MVKRKKRLLKGISSLKEQIELHKKKRDIAKEEGLEELTRYYEKEIEGKIKTKKEKERLLKRKGR